MTPRELAEKIWSIIGLWNIEVQTDDEARFNIESLLTEALGESEKRGQQDCVEAGPCATKLNEAKAAGYRQGETDATAKHECSHFETRQIAVKEAYEECAKIAEGWIPEPIYGEHGRAQDQTANGISEKIRQRAKELKHD